MAAVLGHEIAHVIAHHHAERMSSNILALIGVVAAALFLSVPENISSIAFDLLLNLPNTRTQEVRGPAGSFSYRYHAGNFLADMHTGRGRSYRSQ